MDNLYGPDSAVAVRYGYSVYHGRADPYSARNCYYRGAGKRHSRAEDSLEWKSMSYRNLSHNPLALAGAKDKTRKETDHET